MIRFEVPGNVEPAGSKRAFKHAHTGALIVTDANSKAKPWKASVAASGREAMAGRDLFRGPVSLMLVFYRPRPKGHMGTGRNAQVVKPSAPAYPITKPDVLKLARAVEDALTGVVWADDAQIVDEHLVKAYGPACCVVEVHELRHEPWMAERQAA